MVLAGAARVTNLSIYGSGDNVWGLLITGNGTPVITNLYVSINNTGTESAKAILIHGRLSLIQGGHVLVLTANGVAVGIDVSFGSAIGITPFIEDLYVSAASSGSTAVAMQGKSDVANQSVAVANSVLFGDTTFMALNAANSAGSLTAFISDTLLSDTVTTTTTTGTVTLYCVGDYSASYTSLDSSCQ